ncbi:MAG: hypothetical protein O3A25_16350 [Acidobacteria bacterium]|nr:hypothetical protein [Acidobacteriota bacterium]
MRLLTPKTCQHLAGAIGLVAVVLFAPIESAAQARGFVSVNGGFQATSNDFTEGITFLSNGEDASATTTHAVDAGGLLDVSGGVFVTEQFAIGAGFSRYDMDSDAAVSANLPHPFFFNLDRLVDGASRPGAPRTWCTSRPSGSSP